MGKRAIVIGADGRRKRSMTDTVVTRYAAFAEAFTPGWDEDNGGSATRRTERLRQRTRLGQKKTPIGRGTLIRRG